MLKKPFVLLILDGWGYRAEAQYNPTRSTPTPTIDALFLNNPNLLIEASGHAVGLPDGQMGNSEVGHLHIGSGRKVPQDLVRINDGLKDGSFFKNPALLQAINTAKKNNKAVHIIGLVSDGGVHSHVNHIDALIHLVHAHGVAKNYCHVITDGRDTPPQSALAYVNQIEKTYETITGGIASVTGRYYAMDRDQRWERTEKAYDMLTGGEIPPNPPFSKGGVALSPSFPNERAIDAIKQAYTRGETDEFIVPTPILVNGKRISIEDGDVVIFANFRADRARQLTRAFIEPHFSAFSRKKKIALSNYTTVTEYLENPTIHVAYPPISLKNTLGEFLSQQGLTQLRLAETEKYAHVTYFLNGGIETPYPDEDRTLIPSPKVATYDLQPQMSAIAVTDALIDAIENRQYDVIICNYANPDMIGHTGVESAANEAVSVIDNCLARVIAALKKVGGEALITADHGNIELMYDEKTGQPHTAHTTNPVPLIYIGRPALTVATTGALDDVAPSLLYLMGLSKPAEMTGKSVFELKQEA